MATTIRPATRGDIPQILRFIRALAAYEREPEAVTATEAGLERDGFGPNPFYFCLMAEYDGKAAGFALYFFNYSTWLGRPFTLLARNCPMASSFTTARTSPSRTSSSTI